MKLRQIFVLSVALVFAASVASPALAVPSAMPVAIVAANATHDRRAMLRLIIPHPHLLGRFARTMPSCGCLTPASTLLPLELGE